MDFIIEDTNPNLSFEIDCSCDKELHVEELVQVVNGKDGIVGKDGKDGQNGTAVIDYDEQSLRAFYNNITT